MLRSGQVRVNKKRVKASYRLQLDDVIRIPPVQSTDKEQKASVVIKPAQVAKLPILYEDKGLLVINKPAGMAVHGGSGVSFGVIEQLRHQHPDWKFLELVHRLDRETSGVLLLAKKRSVLVNLHRQIREGLTQKYYLVMVKGQWRHRLQHVKFPLNKYVTASGERRVAIATGKEQSGKNMTAHTILRLLKTWPQFSLLQAELKTGRTHQIRVHLAHLGFPIVGDDKYGDFALNKQLANKKNDMLLERMFLHAQRMQIINPESNEKLVLEAPLAPELQFFIDSLGD